MKNIFLILCLWTMMIGLTSVFGQNISDEARRHYDRGMAAVELAKSPADYEIAITEFKQAIALAPDWADAYYNLGRVQEAAEKFTDAIASFRQYLRLAPEASDAGEVRSLINKLEFKQEQEEGVKKVYQMMAYSTKISVLPHVGWKKISENGNHEPDWEIEHGNDFGLTPNIFQMKDGILYKSSYSVSPKTKKYWVMSPDGFPLPVKVSGRFFEYRYSGSMISIVGYPDGSPLYDKRDGGELSIKGEIISVDQPRIKREQTLKWPDGQTSITEFVYELIVNLSH